MKIGQRPAESCLKECSKSGKSEVNVANIPVKVTGINGTKIVANPDKIKEEKAAISLGRDRSRVRLQPISIGVVS